MSICSIQLPFITYLGYLPLRFHSVPTRYNLTSPCQPLSTSGSILANSRAIITCPSLTICISPSSAPAMQMPIIPNQSGHSPALPKPTPNNLLSVTTFAESASTSTRSSSVPGSQFRHLGPRLCLRQAEPILPFRRPLALSLSLSLLSYLSLATLTAMTL